MRGKGQFNRKPCVWNGVMYPSQIALARAIDVSPERVSYWIRKGYQSDSDINQTHKPVLPSVRCINLTTIELNLKGGYSTTISAIDADLAEYRWYAKYR